MKKALFLFLMIFVFHACSSETKKVTPESTTAKEAFALAEELKEAYLKRDLADIENISTKEGYREILGAMKSFDEAELSFEPKWVEIDESAVSLKIAWQGKWVVAGKTTEERGTAIFVLEGSPLKLRRILRANPFRQPE